MESTYTNKTKSVGSIRYPTQENETELTSLASRMLQVIGEDSDRQGLTKNIAEEVDRLIQPKGVALVIEASHLCMMMRGVGKQNSITITKSTLGAFSKDDGLKAEFLALLNR